MHRVLELGLEFPSSRTEARLPTLRHTAWHPGVQLMRTQVRGLCTGQVLCLARSALLAAAAPI